MTWFEFPLKVPRSSQKTSSARNTKFPLPYTECLELHSISTFYCLGFFVFVFTLIPCFTLWSCLAVQLWIPNSFFLDIFSDPCFLVIGKKGEYTGGHGNNSKLGINWWYQIMFLYIDTIKTYVSRKSGCYFYSVSKSVKSPERGTYLWWIGKKTQKNNAFVLFTNFLLQ